MSIKELPEWMIVDSVRYSIGRSRSTYHTMTITDWVIKHWNEISLLTQDIICKDVEDAFRRYGQGQNSLGRATGHKCDKELWENVRKLWVNKENNYE